MAPTTFHSEAARDAVRRAAAALDAAETSGQPLAISRALADAARATLALGAVESADGYCQMALRWAHAAGSNDEVADLLCAGAEIAMRLAAALDEAEAGSGRPVRERARDHAFEAAALVNRNGDAGGEARVLLRVAGVLERCGDRDDAMRLQARALRPIGGRPRPDHAAAEPATTGQRLNGL